MTTLIELNAARALNNKTPLKAWKESKAKLQEAIIKEQVIAIDEKGTQQMSDELKHIADDQLTHIQHEPQSAPATKPIMIAEEKAKTDRRVKALDKKAKAAKAEGAKINVAAIAKELGVNPKVARAKVRKAGAKTVKEIRDLLTKK